MWKEEGKRCSQRKSSEHKSKISKSVKSFEAQKDINKHKSMKPAHLHENNLDGAPAEQIATMKNCI